MKKSSIETATIAIIIILTATPAVILIWFFIGSFGVFTPNPPKPEITYGEFPFVLEYEVDGVYHKYEDVLICEFDGFEFILGLAEKRRKWNAYYKSGNEIIMLFKNKKIEIFFFPNQPNSDRAHINASILMGDSEYSPRNLTNFPDALCVAASDETKYLNAKGITADKLLEEYNIRLISWHCAPPIKNTFK